MPGVKAASTSSARFHRPPIEIVLGRHEAGLGRQPMGAAERLATAHAKAHGGRAAIEDHAVLPGLAADDGQLGQRR